MEEAALSRLRVELWTPNPALKHRIEQEFSCLPHLFVHWNSTERLDFDLRPEILIIDLTQDALYKLSQLEQYRRQVPKIIVIGIVKPRAIGYRFSFVDLLFSSRLQTEEKFREKVKVAAEFLLEGFERPTDRWSGVLKESYKYRQLLRRGKINPDTGRTSLNYNEVVYLSGISRGEQHAIIAERLCRSKRTVEGYFGRIATKMDCSNRTEIIARATQLGWLS